MSTFKYFLFSGLSPHYSEGLWTSGLEREAGNIHSFFSRPDFERIVMQVEGKESCVDVARTVCTEVTQPSSGCDIVNSSLNRQI